MLMNIYILSITADYTANISKMFTIRSETEIKFDYTAFGNILVGKMILKPNGVFSFYKIVLLKCTLFALFGFACSFWIMENQRYSLQGVYLIPDSLPCRLVFSYFHCIREWLTFDNLYRTRLNSLKLPNTC